MCRTPMSSMLHQRSQSISQSTRLSTYDSADNTEADGWLELKGCTTQGRRKRRSFDLLKQCFRQHAPGDEDEWTTESYSTYWAVLKSDALWLFADEDSDSPCAILDLASLQMVCDEGAMLKLTLQKATGSVVEYNLRATGNISKRVWLHHLESVQQSNNPHKINLVEYYSSVGASY